MNFKVLAYPLMPYSKEVQLDPHTLDMIGYSVIALIVILLAFAFFVRNK